LDADPITLEGITFRDLQSAEGLRRVDEAFLAQVDEDMRIRVLAYREAPLPPAPLLHSAFLLDLAPWVEALLSRLFGIETAVSAARNASRAHDPVLEIKRHFVQRRARRHRDPINESFAELDVWLERVLRERGWDGNDRESWRWRTSPLTCCMKVMRTRPRRSR
jgi:hypothetical protein